jgi:hypothetical protein
MLQKLVTAIWRLLEGRVTIFNVTMVIVLRVVLCFNMSLEDVLCRRSHPTLTTAVSHSGFAAMLAFGLVDRRLARWRRHLHAIHALLGSKKLINVCTEASQVLSYLR